MKSGYFFRKILRFDVQLELSFELGDQVIVIFFEESHQLLQNKLFLAQASQGVVTKALTVLEFLISFLGEVFKRARSAAPLILGVKVVTSVAQNLPQLLVFVLEGALFVKG